MAGFFPMSVRPMPTDWNTAITIKDPSKEDKLGYIDPVQRGATFKMLGADETPLEVKQPRTPYECFTQADCMGKGRGKITLRIEMNAPMWEALHKLDEYFKVFLIRNRSKLFGATDAEFIGRDNNAIALKMGKPLAPVDADGRPLIVGQYVTFRINGRAGEIGELVCKDGSTGRYVSSIEWLPRSSPLTSSATRFSIVTGTATDGKPIIRDTLQVEGPVPAGAQRVRFVGPGDIKKARARHVTFRPAYWSMAPGGSAGITLVLDTLVFENVADDDGAAAPVAQSYVPEGFVAYDAESAAGGGGGGASNAAEAHPAHAPPHQEKRRRTTGLDLFSPSEAEPFTRLAPPAPIAPHRMQRSNTGGAGGGTVAGGFFSRSVVPLASTASQAAAGGGDPTVRAMLVAADQAALERAMADEHQHMRATSGPGHAAYEFTQRHHDSLSDEDE